MLMLGPASVEVMSIIIFFCHLTDRVCWVEVLDYKIRELKALSPYVTTFFADLNRLT